MCETGDGALPGSTSKTYLVCSAVTKRHETTYTHGTTPQFNSRGRSEPTCRAVPVGRSTVCASAAVANTCSVPGSIHPRPVAQQYCPCDSMGTTRACNTSGHEAPRHTKGDW